jgi:hypothetical protein
MSERDPFNFRKRQENPRKFPEAQQKPSQELEKFQQEMPEEQKARAVYINGIRALIKQEGFI